MLPLVSCALLQLALAGGPVRREPAPYVSKQWSDTNGMVHSGTPGGVPASADCAIRQFAYEQGKKMAPQRGDFKSLYDALQLGACPDASPEPKHADAWAPPRHDLAATSARVLFVDAAAAAAGIAANATGGADAPYATLHAAVRASRALPKPLAILLRGGTHFVGATVELGAADSGLTIANADGEAAVLSGGRNLTGLSWAPSAACGAGCFEADLSAMGGEWGIAGLRVDGVREIRARWPNADPERSSVIAGKLQVHDGTTGWVTAATDWVQKGADMNGVPGVWPDDAGAPTTYAVGAADWPGVEWPMSQYVDGKPVPNAWTGEGDWGQYWLGVNGTCVDRSPPVGYWCAPGAPRRISTPNHPGGIHVDGRAYANPAGAVVHAWRPGHWYTNMFEVRGVNATSQAAWTFFPNVNAVSGHCPSPQQCAKGVTPLGHFGTLQQCQSAVNASDANASTAPVASYTYHHADAAVGAFAGWCYAMDATVPWQDKAQKGIDSGRAPYTDEFLAFGRGGFQGGEGVTGGENWYIENVLEELDMGREWFFNGSSRMLYYMPNETVAAWQTRSFVATDAKELIKVVGTQAAPARHIAITGLTLRDTAYTYMDPHGLPSGGDWALQKQGAITLVGTEGVEVRDCLLTRLDGNGIFIGGYNRNLTVASNEFVYIGDSAMAAWGDTSGALNQNGSLAVPYPVGPDGRGGDQPRGCKISGNIVHEIGLWQKQSSLWFQAVTAQTQLQDNIFFNGPRAAFNFNDGFGGGDDISGNLLLNTCRESSDHGPWNSWDRVPYITELRHGAGHPSVIPADRHIHHNFIVGNYNSQETIDTDDGSAYLKVYNNFLAYADNGLKTDFGGHDEVYRENVLAYTGDCWHLWTFMGYNNGFFNNSCVFRGGSQGPGYNSDCFKAPQGAGFEVHDNSLFSASGTANVCGTTLANWTAQGHDKGTTVDKWPADADLVAMGRAVLAAASWMKPSQNSASLNLNVDQPGAVKGGEPRILQSWGELASAIALLPTSPSKAASFVLGSGFTMAGYNGANGTAITIPEGCAVSIASGGHTVLDAGGKGSFFVVEGSLTAEGISFKNGVARGIGGNNGGAFRTDGSATFTRCSFINNSAPAGDGGVAHVYAHASATFTSCSFAQNSAHAGGGAVDVYLGTARFVNCSFEVDNRGAALKYNGIYDGGTITFGCPAGTTGADVLLKGNGTNRCCDKKTTQLPPAQKIASCH